MYIYICVYMYVCVYICVYVYAYIAYINLKGVNSVQSIVPVCIDSYK